MKILLVDDDSFLRDMYATKFTESGHEVDTAKSGEEALEKIRKSTYDVMLLDVVMPGISGIDLLKKTREEKKEQAPKCVVLSNQGEQSDVDMAKEAGAVGYIIKAEMIPSEVVAKVEGIIPA